MSILKHREKLPDESPVPRAASGNGDSKSARAAEEGNGSVEYRELGPLSGLRGLRIAGWT